MRIHLPRIASATAVVIFTTVGSHAATLLPGGSTFLPGTTLAERPDLAGTVLEDDLLFPYDFYDEIVYLGGHQVQSRVTTTTGSALNFSVRLRDPSNNGYLDLLVDSVTLTGYAGFATDVLYRSDSSGDVGPSFAARSADGDAVTFDFAFPLFFGNLTQEEHQESYFLSIVTDAPSYAQTGRMIVTGHSSEHPGTILTAEIGGLWAPAALPTVPLPLSGWLLLGCLGALWKLRRLGSPASA